MSLLLTVPPNLVQSIRAFRVTELQDEAIRLGQHFLYAHCNAGQTKQQVIGIIAEAFLFPKNLAKNFDALRLWYCDRFDLKRRPLRQSKIRIIQEAQGLGPDTIMDMTTAGLREPGYLLEFDAYPTGPGRIAGPRPCTSGELPPGCAMASFGVTDLDLVADVAIMPAMVREGMGYNGRRTATAIGPTGERVEFIED